MKTQRSRWSRCRVGKSDSRSRERAFYSVCQVHASVAAGGAQDHRVAADDSWLLSYSVLLLKLGRKSLWEEGGGGYCGRVLMEVG